MESSEKKCHIEELYRLKESSRESVEGVDEFSEFKQYMHVPRAMHLKLEELVKDCSQSKTQKLLLVCGSVGDGKSHIISYLKYRYPEVLENFELGNDATESLEPTKTAMDTLNERLKYFNDENIGKNNKKFILAINLGTLNNFIDSKYGGEFSSLKKFVYEKKLLDSTIEEDNYDDNSPFQFINFGDYHIYELENEMVKSSYISELIKKITNKDESNNFYRSYCSNCLVCENKDLCPIKSNYELLSNEQIRDNLVKLLIEVIIKKKLLISTRALLNFIFDLIVGKNSIKVEQYNFKRVISTININQYVDSLLPNLLFNSSDLSFIFNSIAKLDPLNIRNSEVDNFIVEFTVSNKPLQVFYDNINYLSIHLGNLGEIDFATTTNNELKDKLLTLFIRSYILAPKTNIFTLQDSTYNQFIKDLYNWNKYEKSKLKELYNKVKVAMIRWNGEADSGEINLFMGKKQLNYKVSEEVEIKSDLSNLRINKKEKLERFSNSFKLKYKTNKSEAYEFDIDYELYETLQKVVDGYRPNKKDREHYIKFIETLNSIIESGSQKEKIFFVEKNQNEKKKYKLEYDEDFGGFSFGGIENDGV